MLMLHRNNKPIENGKIIRQYINAVVRYSRGEIIFKPSRNTIYYLADISASLKDGWITYLGVEFDPNNPGDVRGSVYLEYDYVYIDFKSHRWANRTLANYQLMQKLMS